MVKYEVTGFNESRYVIYGPNNPDFGSFIAFTHHLKFYRTKFGGYQVVYKVGYDFGWCEVGISSIEIKKDFLGHDDYIMITGIKF